MDVASCLNPDPPVHGLFEPRIDRNRCEGKGPCVSACPHGVLELATLSAADRLGLSLKGAVKAWAHGHRQAFAVRADLCRACGSCVRVCPEQAITLHRVAADPQPLHP